MKSTRWLLTLVSHRVAIPLLAFATMLSFGRILQNGFTFDDFSVLLNNPAVTDGAPVSRILLDPTSHSAADAELVWTYRPLRTSLLALEFRAFGKDPAPYHALNLVLHFIVCLLFRSLARRLFGEPSGTLTALLYACHPLLVEVVASVKAQDDLVSAVAVLSACLLFLEGQRAPHSLRRTWPLFALASVVGLLAKENAVVLPALLVLIAFFSQGGTQRKQSATWAPIIAITIACGIFLAVRNDLLQSAHGALTRPHGASLFSTVVYNIPRYWRLFLWPQPLTADYSHLAIIPWTSRVWILNLGLQVLIAGVAWWSRDPRARFGLAWSYVALSPTFDPKPFLVFAERFAYVPAFGFALVIIGLLARFLAPSSRSYVSGATAFLFALVVVSLGARSAKRCLDWRSNDALLRSALSVRPDSRIVRGFLVSDLLRRGETGEARAILAQDPAIETRVPLSYRDRRALSSLALIALQEEDYRHAAMILEGITESEFAKTADWLNLGTAWANMKDYARARRAFQEVLRENPDDAAAERMLGRIALETHDLDEAVRRFERARELEPGHALGQYYALYASWRARGDEVAIRRLQDLKSRGISVAPWIREDEAAWDAAGPDLEALLRSFSDP